MVNIYRPETVSQALDNLTIPRTTLFAGGTDLMVKHGVRTGMRPAFKQDVVFTDAIAELKSIIFTENDTKPVLSIGAAATLSEIERCPHIPELLRQAVIKIAAPAIRNRATLAGNICNASPAADSLPVLYVLNARVVLASVHGQRQLKIAEFISGPGKTALHTGEMLTHILLPAESWSETFYHKVGTRAANALTKVSVAGVAQLYCDDSGETRLKQWRVAFGAVGPTVIRHQELESSVTDLPVKALLNPENIEPLVSGYQKLIQPINDQRSTAAYRHTAALNLLKRWLAQLSEL